MARHALQRGREVRLRGIDARLEHHQCRMQAQRKQHAPSAQHNDGDGVQQRVIGSLGACARPHDQRQHGGGGQHPCGTRPYADRRAALAGRRPERHADRQAGARQQDQRAAAATGHRLQERSGRVQPGARQHQFDRDEPHAERGRGQSNAPAPERLGGGSKRCPGQDGDEDDQRGGQHHRQGRGERSCGRCGRQPVQARLSQPQPRPEPGAEYDAAGETPDPAFRNGRPPWQACRGIQRRKRGQPDTGPRKQQ